MFIGDFEKIIAIKFAQGRRNLIKHQIKEFAPPVSVIVRTRSVDGGTPWHLFPSDVKRAIKLPRVQRQTYLTPDERIMIAHGLGEIKQRADGVKGDGFDHRKQTFNVY